MSSTALSVAPLRPRPAGGARRRGRARLQRAGRAAGSIRRLHDYLDRAALRLADRHRRQREHRRDAADRHRAGGRPARRRAAARCRRRGAAARCGRRGSQRGRRRLLHGRRPLDRPARAAAAARAAALRAQRRGDRDAPGARLAGRARPQARADLALATTGCCTRARRALLRRAVRLQGGPRDAARRLLPERARRGVVLRHRAARARPARGDAHPRGAGRLGRRPRLARGHRAHRARGPARHRAPARRGAADPLPRASACASTVAYALLFLALRGAARRRGRERARAGA